MWLRVIYKSPLIVLINFYLFVIVKKFLLTFGCNSCSEDVNWCRNTKRCIEFSIDKFHSFYSIIIADYIFNTCNLTDFTSILVH